MVDVPRTSAVHVIVVAAPRQKKKRLHELLPEGTTPALFAGLQYSDSWTRVLRKRSGQLECYRHLPPMGEEGVKDNQGGGSVGDTLPVPPIALLHETFARFQDNLLNIPITNTDCEFVVEICKAIAIPMNYTLKYVNDLGHRLGSYLHIELCVVSIDCAPCEGVFRPPKMDEGGVLNLICRPHRAGGVGDPAMENVGHYLKQLPASLTTQRPCFLVDICGRVLTIFGAVNVSDRRAVCEPLAPMASLVFVDNEQLMTATARTFAALPVAITELREWKRGPQQEATRFHPGYALFSGVPPRPWFPYMDTVKTGETQADEVVATLEYKRVLTSTLFEAWLETDVVVKFASRRYGSIVHHFLHSHHFAPRLLHCDQATEGGWIFVVMEKIADLQPLDKVEDRQMMRGQLQELEGLLKTSGLVHGDLRRENVWWDAAKQHVVVLDFDWAGEDGVATYPVLLNVDTDCPEGVDCGMVIRAAHDAERLSRLCA